jgi:hypothetical protein
MRSDHGSRNAQMQQSRGDGVCIVHERGEHVPFYIIDALLTIERQ